MKHYGREPYMKPYKIPKGLIILQDTREQLPLFETKMDGLTVVRATLHDGDYSIKGFENKFGIERKQISDLYSYVGKERSKTVIKLERLSKLDFAALIIEASPDDLKIPYSFSSQITPEMIRQFLVSVNIRYGVHIYCDRDRESLKTWLVDRAIKYYKIQREIR